MKTLDEVIKAFECCEHGEPDSNCKECSYISIGACCLERENDALFYLKEFQGLSKMWNDKLDKEQTNPALTWDELRTMEGKPVWIEEENHPSQWYLIDEIETDEDDDPEFVSMNVYDCQGDYWFYYKNNMGTIWQAYRKERE